MFNISLAPIKYRNVYASKGGPIKHLEYLKREIMFGPQNMGYEAYAYLDDSTSSSIGTTYNLYGNADGQGSDANKITACFKAISEALERQAFKETSLSSLANKYGFNIENSTSGLAAFPGITKYTAKESANHEAIERWAITEWWLGNLSIEEVKYKPESGIHCFQIITPWHPKIVVVLLYRTDASDEAVGVDNNNSQLNLNRTSFGFAAGNDLSHACKRAEIELMRNHFILKTKLNSTNSVSTNLSHTNNDLSVYERRLLYFSESAGDGFLTFKEQIKKSENTHNQNHAFPKLLIDTEVVGEWSKYTTVWRCLYQHQEYKHLENSSDFFYF